MKKRLLETIAVRKEKLRKKRGRHYTPRRPRDAKDLRGAKGVLLKNALDAELAGDQRSEALSGPRPIPSGRLS